MVAGAVSRPVSSTPWRRPRPIQDYLGPIYDLTGGDKPVIGAQLARHMHVSAPSHHRGAAAHAARGLYPARRARRRSASPARALAIAETDGAAATGSRALAHRRARARLVAGARRGAPPRARALAGGGGAARRDARHAEHLPPRQPDPRHAGPEAHNPIPLSQAQRGPGADGRAASPRRRRPIASCSASSGRAGSGRRRLSRQRGGALRGRSRVHLVRAHRHHGPHRGEQDLGLRPQGTGRHRRHAPDSARDARCGSRAARHAAREPGRALSRRRGRARWRSRASTRSRTASSASSGAALFFGERSGRARPDPGHLLRDPDLATASSSSTPASRRARWPGLIRSDPLARFTDARPARAPARLARARRPTDVGPRRALPPALRPRGRRAALPGLRSWSCSRTSTLVTRNYPVDVLRGASTTGSNFDLPEYYRWRLPRRRRRARPGVTVLRTDGHTPGHQSLLVELPETGPVILAGDSCYWQDNHRPRDRRRACVLGPEPRHALDQAPQDASPASRGGRIFPSHDPAFWSQSRESSRRLPVGERLWRVLDGSPILELARVAPAELPGHAARRHGRRGAEDRDAGRRSLTTGRARGAPPRLRQPRQAVAGPEPQGARGPGDSSAGCAATRRRASWKASAPASPKRLGADYETV